jgi:hypothetical protein
MIGYLRAVINAVWVALLFLGVAAGATAVDRRLPGRAPGQVQRGA